MEFKKVKLGECVDYILDYRGKTPKKSKTGIPTLSAKSVKNNFIDYDEVYYISRDEYNRFMSKGFPRIGDILMTMEAPLGLVATLDRDDVGLGQRIVTIRGKKDFLDNNYLKFYLQSPKGQHELYSRATGTTVVGISQKNLKNIDIVIPSLENQIRIGRILNNYNIKIEINNKIISNLESQAQAIFKSWFVDFEPFQDGNFVESELGMIPEGWEVKELGEIINLYDNKRVPISKMDRDKMEKNYPYYGANGIIDYVDNYLFDGKYLLMGEDGTVRTEEGFPILNYVDEKFWVSNHAHIMRGTLVSTEYIYLLLSKMFINNIVTGAVQEKINQRNLKKIKIIFPEKKELESFEKIIEPMFKMKLYLNNQNTKLAELRDALLPKLMAGEIDVSNIKIEGEEVKNE